MTRARVASGAARRFAVGLLALGVVGAGFAIFLNTRSDPPPVAAPLAVEEPLPVEEPLSSYRLVYRVTGNGASKVEETLVKRPSLGRSIVRHTGSSEIVAGTITNDEGLWVLSRGAAAGWYIADPRVQASVRDLRPTAVLTAALEDGRAQRRGEGRVLGRRCTVVRTGAPVGRELEKPSSDDHVDLCLDRTGVVLQLEWVSHGKVVERKVATEFVPDAVIDDALFTAAPRAELDPRSQAGLGVARRLEHGETGALPARVDPPAGFDELGTWRIMRLEGDVAVPIEAFSQAFLRRGDGALLRAEFTQVMASTIPVGDPIELPGGRVGRLELVLGTSNLTVELEHGWIVRLFSHDPAVLLAAARDVVPQGTTSSPE